MHVNRRAKLKNIYKANAGGREQQETIETMQVPIKAK